MIDGLRDIFLEALHYVPEQEQTALIDKWNSELENVYQIKEALKQEIYLSQRGKSHE